MSPRRVVAVPAGHAARRDVPVRYRVGRRHRVRHRRHAARRRRRDAHRRAATASASTTAAVVVRHHRAAYRRFA